MHRIPKYRLHKDVLTQLGSRFVSYAMTDVVTRLPRNEMAPSSTTGEPTPPPAPEPMTEEEDDAGISSGTMHDLPRSDYGPSPY